MARRVSHAYVFDYTDNGRRAALAFCSPGCGVAALEHGAEIHWPACRVLVASRLRDVVRCYGCGLSVAEVEEASAVVR